MDNRGLLIKAILFCIIICTSLLLIQVVPALAIFVDFETYPDGSSTSHFDPVDIQFSSWGISEITSLQYNPATGSFDIVPAIIRQDVLTNPYPSGIRALAPMPGDGTYYGPAQAPIAVHFSTPLNYFSVYAVDVGWNGLIAEAYDADSILLSSIIIDGTGRAHYGEPGGDGLDFIEFLNSGISMIIFYQIHDAQWDAANGLGTEGYLLDSMHLTTYYAFNLTDTGQTQSYSTTFGEDSDYDVNPPSYEISPDSLTVFDYNTGIVWQREDDGITRTWSEAVNYCDNLNLSNYSDWRLPAKKELMSVADYGTFGPAIASEYFPNTKFDSISNSVFYWSSTVNADTSNPQVLALSFYNGTIDLIGKSGHQYARCMRVNSYPPPIFVDNGDGTVSDNSTRLMWQQGESNLKNWSNALSYCEGLSLANHNDWRLPNIKELQSIVDDGKYNPAIDKNYFPYISTSAEIYWSSSTCGNNTGRAFFVYFLDGRVLQNDKLTRQRSVRCVRGGNYVRIMQAPSIYYSRLQTGYDTSLEGDTVQVQAAELNEDIFFDLNKSVAIKGGYDSSFTTNSGITTINGNMTISDGTLTIEDIIIE